MLLNKQTIVTAENNTSFLPFIHTVWKHFKNFNKIHLAFNSNYFA